jgi:dolichol-phosphate mannosyltransferase
VRSLAGLSCVDCTSGFRGYRAGVLQRAQLSRIRTTGYAFLPELLFNLDGASIAEVPVCYTERRLGESKMSKGVIAEALVRPWTLFLTRVGRRALRRFGRQ